MLHISSSLTVPADELQFRFSRSSGPGGQHVNRSATQVELLFDVKHSPSLTDGQRALVHHRLRRYIDKEGVLHLVSSGTRSQFQNREEVIERFVNLMDRALRVPKPRRPTRPTQAARERRLQEKRRRSQIKQERRTTGE